MMERAAPANAVIAIVHTKNPTMIPGRLSVMAGPATAFPPKKMPAKKR